MPLLFTLGQHSALEAVNSRLQEDDRLMAFLDDVCVVNPRPDSVLHSYTALNCGPTCAYGSMEARQECGTAEVRNLTAVTSSRELQSSWTQLLSCGEAQTSPPCNRASRFSGHFFGRAEPSGKGCRKAPKFPGHVAFSAEPPVELVASCVLHASQGELSVAEHSDPDKGHGHPSSVAGRIAPCR